MTKNFGDYDMGDLIDRKEAIKAIENLTDCYNGFSDTYDKSCIIGVLEEVPSAEKTGRWMAETLDGAIRYRPIVMYCSECGMVATAKTNFCPYCGADMREK